MRELGEEVEIVAIHSQIDGAMYVVGYRTQATGSFTFSIMVSAKDEVDAFKRFPDTLEYWQDNALPPDSLVMRKFKDKL